MNRFDNGSITDMNISDRYSYIILDTTIRDDECMQAVQRRHDSNVIELVGMIFKIVIVTFDKKNERRKNWEKHQ